MVDRCLDQGLDVELADAFQYLQGANEKFDIISAFHLIEHMPFSDWSELVRLSYEKLNAGGLLILETPNPENLVVGTMNFYVDPTHLRPIPPQLLSFVLDLSGFEEAHFFRLNSSGQRVTRYEAISGYAPDLGVIAIKQGGDKLSGLARASELKPNLDDWVNSQAESELVELRNIANLQSERLDSVDARTEKVRAGLDDLRTAIESNLAHKSEIESLYSKIDELGNRLEESERNHEATIQDIRGSWSWRLTKPLRLFGLLFRR